MTAVAGRGARTSTAEAVALPDGSVVVVRPVHPTDAPLLLDGFARLSPHSRRQRFLTAKTELTAAELRQLTELDHHDREALGAVDVATGRGVGVARYVRAVGDPQTAEVAVTVVDEWQRRGVATALLHRLAVRARGSGIFAFSALVSVDNDAMTALLRAVAGVELTHLDADVAEYEIALVPFIASLRCRAA